MSALTLQRPPSCTCSFCGRSQAVGREVEELCGHSLTYAWAPSSACNRQSMEENREDNPLPQLQCFPGASPTEEQSQVSSLGRGWRGGRGRHAGPQVLFFPRACLSPSSSPLPAFVPAPSCPGMPPFLFLRFSCCDINKLRGKKNMSLSLDYNPVIYSECLSR